MATVGTDCHLTLQHNDVNGGAAYGFLLDPGSRYPEGIAIKREIYSEETDPNKLWVYFDILLADDLINPDGSAHGVTRAAMYAKLVEFLGKQSDITLSFGLGAIISLGALEYAATEKHYPSFSVIRVQLTNVDSYYGVIDETVLYASVWDGTLTWETSYWRLE
jgi:hypothetical protein